MSGAVPIHARNHRLGGVDPLDTDLPIATIATRTNDEGCGALTGMTFEFEDANFTTSHPAYFEERTGAPFGGIRIRKTGLYVVCWAVNVVVDSGIATPETIGIEVAPGSSPDETYLNEIDISRSETYGRIWTPGSSESHWYTAFWAFMGISGVASERWLTLGAFNRSTHVFTEGFYGRITAVRIGQTLADYSEFF